MDPSFMKSPGSCLVNTTEHFQETVEVGIAIKLFPNYYHVDFKHILKC